ncbi:MAG: hypothetical protein ACRCUT_13665, partial [Spirochaetota bacterium]
MKRTGHIASLGKKKVKKESAPLSSTDELLPSEETAVPVKHRHPIKRVLIKAVKILFLWIPLSLAAVIAAVFIIADLILSPSLVEKVAVEQFAAASNSALCLDVKKFSLYSDILIENIEIKNPAGFGDGNLFELKRFHLKYGFFSMLIGRVHIDEFEIYKPRIYLIQQKGVWNAEKLMKPSAPKEPEKEEPETAGAPLPAEINLPWPMKFFFNFVLDDLYVYVRGDSFKAELGGVTFRARIDVPPFSAVPLSLKAVSLLKDMEIILNPDEQIDLSFQSDAAGVEPPLIMTWKLLFKKQQDGTTQFESAMKMGTYKTPVRFQRAHLAPLNFLVMYDLFYDPARDYLSLNDFGISFKDKRWIKLQGSVSQVTTRQNIDIRMARSEIALSDLYPYYRAVTGDTSLRFGGTVSLAPLTIKGNPDIIDVNGGINLSGIQIRLPAFELALPSMSLTYGLAKKGPDAKISADLFLPRFTYKLDRSPSGENAFRLTADINARNNFGRFNINAVDIRYYYPQTKEDALRLHITGDVAVAPSMAGTVNITELYFRRDPLASMIAASLRPSIEGIPLQKAVNGTVSASFAMDGGITRAKAGIKLKVPDFNVNDLSLNADIVQNGPRQRIDIRNVSAASPAFGLALNADGFVEMETPPLSDSDLSLSLKLSYPQMTNVYGPWKMKGTVAVNAGMKGDLIHGKAKGSIKIDHFSVSNSEPDMMLDLADVNMNFPFEYDFAYKPPAGSRLGVDKSRIIDSVLFREKDNFTIRSFAMKHPARDTQFVMMKDLKGALFFRSNTFEIQKLSMNVLDGTIYGKDIFFYLSDMNPANMQYNFTLDLTNLDIGRLDDPDPAHKKR